MAEPTFFEQVAEVYALLAVINQQEDDDHFADPETMETDEEEEE